MIAIRLKINYSENEFLIIRSPFSKIASLQNSTISVGGSSIRCSETAIQLELIVSSESHIAHVSKIRNLITDH